MNPKIIYTESYHQNYSPDLIERKNVTQAIFKYLDFEDKIGFDAGCNGGFLTFFLLKNGAKKVYGCDISPQFISESKSKAKKLGLIKVTDFKVADLHKLPYKKSFFDFIVCTEVLEHLDNPQKAIDEFHRVLKKERLILLTTPNIYNPIELLHNLKHYLFWILKRDKITHIQHFTFRKIHKLLAKFEITKVEGLGIGLAFLPNKYFGFLRPLDLALGKYLKPLAFDILVMAKKK